METTLTKLEPLPLYPPTPDENGGVRLKLQRMREMLKPETWERGSVTLLTDSTKSFDDRNEQVAVGCLMVHLRRAGGEYNDAAYALLCKYTGRDHVGLWNDTHSYEEVSAALDAALASAQKTNEVP